MLNLTRCYHAKKRKLEKQRTKIKQHNVLRAAYNERTNEKGNEKQKGDSFYGSDVTLSACLTYRRSNLRPRTLRSLPTADLVAVFHIGKHSCFPTGPATRGPAAPEAKTKRKTYHVQHSDRGRGHGDSSPQTMTWTGLKRTSIWTRRRFTWFVQPTSDQATGDCHQMGQTGP